MKSRWRVQSCGLDRDWHQRERNREIIGLAVGDVESYSTWDSLFSGLRDRGLRAVDFVVSDSHAGLTEAEGLIVGSQTIAEARRHRAERTTDSSGKERAN